MKEIFKGEGRWGNGKGGFGVTDVLSCKLLSIHDRKLHFN